MRELPASPVRGPVEALQVAPRPGRAHRDVLHVSPTELGIGFEREGDDAGGYCAGPTRPSGKLEKLVRALEYGQLF